MAAGTVTATKVLLYDNFPGLILNLFNPPQDLVPGGSLLTISTQMFGQTVQTNACGQNNSTPMFEVGTKIQIKNRGVVGGGVGVPGWSTLSYLKFDPSSASAAVLGDICVPASLAAQQNSGTTPVIPSPYTVARLAANVLSADTELSGGMIAVPLSAITAGNYGWFWVGGVCPADAGASGALLAAVTMLADTGTAVGKPMGVLADATQTTLLSFAIYSAAYLGNPVGSKLLA
jgi:hypothetical protein